MIPSRQTSLLPRPARSLALALLLGLLATPVTLAADRAFLGISSESVSGDVARRLNLPSRDGAIINRVYEDTAAEAAGLKRRDIIVEFGGEKVFDDSDLTEMIRDHFPGDQVSIGILRDGKPMTLQATLGSYADWDEEEGSGLSRVLSGIFGSHHGDRPTLGVHVMELNAQLASYFDVEDEVGILVTQVVRRSPAEAAGIKAGDVIVRVAGSRVMRSGEIGDALEGRSGEQVTVDLIRKGSRQQVSVQLED